MSYNVPTHKHMSDRETYILQKTAITATILKSFNVLRYDIRMETVTRRQRPSYKIIFLRNAPAVAAVAAHCAPYGWKRKVKKLSDIWKQ